MQFRTEVNELLSLKDDYGKVRNEQILIVSKCISDDSFIDTPSGLTKLRELKENEEFKIISYDFNNNKLEEDIAIKINSGKKEVFEIETESGKKIKASKDHIFFTDKGENILGNLNVGDKIFVRYYEV